MDCGNSHYWWDVFLQLYVAISRSRGIATPSPSCFCRFRAEQYPAHSARGERELSCYWLPTHPFDAAHTFAFCDGVGDVGALFQMEGFLSRAIAVHGLGVFCGDFYLPFRSRVFLSPPDGINFWCGMVDGELCGVGDNSLDVFAGEYSQKIVYQNPFSHIRSNAAWIFSFCVA